MSDKNSIGFWTIGRQNHMTDRKCTNLIGLLVNCCFWHEIQTSVYIFKLGQKYHNLTSSFCWDFCFMWCKFWLKSMDLQITLEDHHRFFFWFGMCHVPFLVPCLVWQRNQKSLISAEIFSLGYFEYDLNMIEYDMNMIEFFMLKSFPVQNFSP